MANHATRRAFEYRRRAAKLAEDAERVRDDADRRHLLDMAATCQRAADQLAPLSPGEVFLRGANRI
jgi:hypothetical protein